METYEIRFLSAGGETLLVYVTRSDGPPDLAVKLTIGEPLPYERFELWRGKERLLLSARRSPGAGPVL